MKFTRRQVLDAIRFENLIPGNFFSAPTTEDKKCEVCAVGGVLRRVGIETSKINHTAKYLLETDTEFNASSSGNEFQALNNKNYLLALSIKFKKLADHHGIGKRTRQKLADFVKEYFPKEFETLRG